MKTLQECKDQAAKNWNEAFDFTALFNGVSVGNIKMIHLRRVIDEAMELYARAKWDQAIEHDRNYMLSTFPAGRELIAWDFIIWFKNHIESSKPEFKP